MSFTREEEEQYNRMILAGKNTVYAALQSGFVEPLFSLTEEEIIKQSEQASNELGKNVYEIPASEFNIEMSCIDTELKVIAFLLKNHAPLPSTQTGTTDLIHAILSNEYGEYDKTIEDKKNLLRLINEYTPEPWPNPEIRHHYFIFFIANGEWTNNARYKTSLEAMLELDWIDAKNINQPDKNGNSIYYHFITKDPDNRTGLLETFKELQCELNDYDLLCIKQNDYAEQLKLSMKKGDVTTINEAIARLEHDPSLLRSNQIRNLLDLAITLDQIDIVKKILALPTIEHHLVNSVPPHIGLAKSKISLEMALLLIEFGLARPQITNSKRLTFSEFSKEIAHRVGLSTYLESINPYDSKDTAGTTGMPALHFLHSALDSYTNTHPSYKEAYRALSIGLLCNELESDTLIASAMSHYYEQGEGIIFSNGWRGHRLGMSIIYDTKTNQTYISISNRGEGGLNAVTANKEAELLVSQSKQKTGTIIYQLDGKLNKSFFKTFKSSVDAFTLESDRTLEEYKKYIANYLKNAKPIAIIPATPQSHPTCSYVNAKRSCEGFYAIQALMKGTTLDEFFINNLYKEYKHFSKHDKENAIHSLLDYYDKALSSNTAQDDITLIHLLMAAIILGHHSDKDEGYEKKYALTLYLLLPKPMQEAIDELIPTPQQETPQKEHSNTQSPASYSFFQRQVSKEKRDILISGNIKSILENASKIKMLISTLNEIFLNQEIRKIAINPDQSLTIYTAYDRETKHSVFRHFSEIISNKDELVNTPGQYQFVVKHIDSLTLAFNKKSNLDI